MRRFLVLYGVFLFFEQVNDTVGALSLGYYHDPDTVVLVVFGTGSNACYLERTDAIIKSQGLLTTSGSMICSFILFRVVNMEWGNFSSSHLPRTSYDIDLDAESPNPNDMVIFGSLLNLPFSIWYCIMNKH
ncbi:unnamed protein product [Brassica oleracea]